VSRIADYVKSRGQRKDGGIRVGFGDEAALADPRHSSTGLVRCSLHLDLHL